MKKSILLSLLCILFLSIISCEKQDDLNVPENLRLNDFIWKGMNQYYLWQEEVTDLSDDRF